MEAQDNKKRQKELVVELLLKGLNAEKALNLTEPMEGSAYDFYQQVLKIEANNKDARGGLKRIVSHYLQLADSAAAKNQLDDAEHYIAKAFSVLPTDNRITFARKKLTQQRTAKITDTVNSDGSAAIDDMDQKTSEEPKKITKEILPEVKEPVKKIVQEEVKIPTKEPLAERIQVKEKIQAKEKTPKINSLQKMQIKLKLIKARDALEKGRLLPPDKNNALDKFSQILSIDSSNKDAENGIQKIVNRLFILVDEAYAKEDLDGAQNYINEVVKITEQFKFIRSPDQK